VQIRIAILIAELIQQIRQLFLSRIEAFVDNGQFSHHGGVENLYENK
jgi:hypothetical protein